MRIYFDAVKYDESECLLISIPVDESDSYIDMHCRVIDLLDINHIDSNVFIIKFSHGFSG